MNTKTDSKSSSTEVQEKKVAFNYNSKDLLNATVLLPNGGYYAIISSGLGFVYLKQQGFPKAKAEKVPIGTILGQVNNGNWPLFALTDESWKEFVYTEEQRDHKRAVLKSLIYNQLCMEANDDLIGTLDHEEYLKNKLLKANKELVRKANKDLKKIYGADQQMIVNIFKTIDKFVGRMADKLPHEYFYLNMVADEYERTKDSFLDRPVHLETIE